MASFVITSLFTTIMFYLDLDAEINALNRTFVHIEKSSVPSLTESLWNYDDIQINEQLKGILALQDMIFVKLINNSEKAIASFGAESLKENISVDRRSFKLIHSGQGQQEKVGTLIVIATKENIYSKMKVKLLNILITQMLKTFLVSFIILYICRTLVTKHLVDISNFLENFDIDQTTSNNNLELRRTNKQVYLDELDDLTGRINQLINLVITNNNVKQGKISEAETKIERQQMNAISSSKLAALGEMAAGIAHEINNPLAIISMSVKYLKKQIKNGSLDEAKILKSIADIERTITRIGRIIRGLRTVSRNSDEQVIENVNIKTIFEDILGLCAEKSKSAGITLKIDLESPEFDCSIFVDRVQLSQVILNIIGNAFDAIEDLENKWVQVNIQKNSGPGFHTIMIADSGAGIPLDVQEKMFNPFFTSKEIGKGTGLGLSISKSLIEGFEGTLSIDNQASSTCFLIKLKSAKS
jgi:two-component system NtrC family sensor kinase